MNSIKSACLFSLLYFSFANLLMAQTPPNYDESKVPKLSLTDLFVDFKGNYIHTKAAWEEVRRPELVETFAKNVYGQLPKDFDTISFKNIDNVKNPLPEEVQMKEVEITVERNGHKLAMNLFVFLPKEISAPLPVLLLISHRPVGDLLATGKDGFFPIEQLVEAGFAAAIFDVEDVSPDDPQRFSEGILNQLYPEQLDLRDGMRGLAAWAWGAMRAMDYFETDSQIDADKSVIVGHSRGGKAALWTGANDPRWAVTVSNESGCGGAALSKRKFGETIEKINEGFPYWFADNFKSFNGQESNMDFDQHLLLATIAPRAIYVASAQQDQWADPKGEFLSLKLGSRVYQEIYGLEGISEDYQNEINTVHRNKIGYHLREGKHDLTPYDWKKFIDFALLQFDPSKK